ncbi:polysaccharide biosynthesis protein [Candidatus Collierbacteria bacterium]|nr:polysaccharide biosynthesis protein [Candidatus Collierbacteria bacterium]
MNNLNRCTILLTGGTGSFGKAFISFLLSQEKFSGTIRVFSRGEYEQYKLQQQYLSDPRIRFLIGDVRDKNRLYRATQGTDVIIHAAALKHVTIAEYNPFEVVKTNIIGSQNIVEVAIDTKVKKVILISSDKAVYPISLYGATKLAAERIFIQGNVYAGTQKTIFAVARFGNFMGSRGSVLPLFSKQSHSGILSLTHPDMTRFWITPSQAAAFVLLSLSKMKGGEIFIPKSPTIKIIDLAKAIAPKAKHKFTGIRQGEKLHEELMTEQELESSETFNNYYVIHPTTEGKLTQPTEKKREKRLLYRSDSNQWQLDLKGIKNLLKLSISPG